MAISFDNTLGIVSQTLTYRTQRAEVLSSNIANVDTPGFKARDLDFKAVLGQQKAQLRLNQTRSGHIALNEQNDPYNVTQTRDTQPSEDGNTVRLGEEQAAFMRNSMAFETSLTFLNMKIKGLKLAITGQ